MGIGFAFVVPILKNSIIMVSNETRPRSPDVPFGHQFWAGSNYWAYFKVIVYCTCTDEVRIKIVSIFNVQDTCETMCGFSAAVRIRIPKNLHGISLS